jgi:membrane protein insertase Oxa1/YidC/SpoIIIJ
LATDFEANWPFWLQIQAFLAIFGRFQSYGFLKSEVSLEGYGFRNLANLYLGA